MTPEGRVLAECRLALSQAGCLVLRNNVGRLQDQQGRWVTYGLGEGSPDLVVVERGRMLGIECKSAAGRVSPEQQQCARMWGRHGVPVYVVRSAEEALTALATAREAWRQG